MTRPDLTAEKSVREQLHELFLAMAQRSFDTCMESQNRVNFYDGVITRVEAGGDISADVPEAKDKSVAEVVAVARKLRQQAAGAAISAWELSAALASSFRTTVRSLAVEGELSPQFDVEHVAETVEGAVRIGIKSWRRNIGVEVMGSDAAVNALNAQMALAALMA
jgi:predicted unusual protein kinase regulating ubiquinone biosynthesis (AarF/ABC1/UbiB family)